MPDNLAEIHLKHSQGDARIGAYKGTGYPYLFGKEQVGELIDGMLDPASRTCGIIGPFSVSRERHTNRLLRQPSYCPEQPCTGSSRSSCLRKGERKPPVREENRQQAGQ
jgi:hypothetical protein